MINICKPGDKRFHSFTVNRKHFPDFKGNVVHKVCSTYILAREIEWSTRLFVLDMLEKDEEGIGTMLKIRHISPALEGEKVLIEATVVSLINNELICSFSAIAGSRQIAEGETGQKIFKKEKLKEIFSGLSK